MPGCVGEFVFDIAPEADATPLGFKKPYLPLDAGAFLPARAVDHDDLVHGFHEHLVDRSPQFADACLVEIRQVAVDRVGHGNLAADGGPAPGDVGGDRIRLVEPLVDDFAIGMTGRACEKDFSHAA